MKVKLYNQYIMRRFKSTRLKDSEVLILAYHHISNDFKSNSTITPKQFKEDIKYLRETGFKFIHFKDLLKISLNLGPYVILTFDDGYSSVYDVVYSELKKYDLKFSLAPILGYYMFNMEKANQKHLVHLTSNQFEELLASNLVEILNHTIDLHNSHGKSLFSNNPCGVGISKINLLEKTDNYEVRIAIDLDLSQEFLFKYKNYSNFFVYPYGRHPKYSKNIIKEKFKGSVITKIGIRKFKNEKDLFDIPRITRRAGLSLVELDIR